MCAVSMMVDAWQTWPKPTVSPWLPQAVPYFPPVDFNKPDPETAKQMLEILAKLEALDKRLGLIDCKIEQAVKDKFVRKLKRAAAKKSL